MLRRNQKPKKCQKDQRAASPQLAVLGLKVQVVHQSRQTQITQALPGNHRVAVAEILKNNSASYSIKKGRTNKV